MKHSRKAFVGIVLTLSMATYLGVPSGAEAQGAQVDDLAKIIMKAMRQKNTVLGAGKAGYAALKAANATKMRNMKAALSMRAKRAVRNEKVFGGIVEENLPEWSELRTLEAIIDAKVESRRASLTADEFAKGTADEMARSTAGRTARTNKRQALQFADGASRHCELNFCEVSALSGDRKIKGSCGPVEISGSKAGDFSFTFGVGPGSVYVSTGTSGTGVGVAASLTDCADLDVFHQIGTTSVDAPQLEGTSCTPCGIGFERLVELFDGPTLEVMETSIDGGPLDPGEIEKLIGDADDWQALRSTIAPRNPNSSVSAVLRDGQYLIEASELEHGEEIRVLEYIWNRLGFSTERIAPMSILCDTRYCPPNQNIAKFSATPGIRISPPSWLRGSCSIPTVEENTNQSDTIWFHIMASKITVNLFSDEISQKDGRKSPLSNHMPHSCWHMVSGNEGDSLTRIPTKHIPSSLADLIDLFSRAGAFGDIRNP